MIKNEIGRIKKNNVTLVEYGEGTVSYTDKFYIQVGVIGLYCTDKELNDLYTVLNYYKNIEDISECVMTLKED